MIVDSFTFETTTQRSHRYRMHRIHFAVHLFVAAHLLAGIDSIITMTTTTTTANDQHSFRTLLLDMDGVLAEVSRSYRTAIVETCHHFGALSVDADAIAAAKTKGNANDDWKLSHALILGDPDGRDDVTLEQVTAKFEELYQGTDDTVGLYTLETLIPTVDTLRELRKRSVAGMGIVTGRPRRDCEKFLRDFQLTELFDVLYCMEDGPSKPDRYPVIRACELLGVLPDRSVVLVGDTPDDIKAAIAAGCTGVGVVTPDGRFDSPLIDAMNRVGASMILPPGFVDLVSYFPTTTNQ